MIVSTDDDDEDETRRSARFSHPISAIIAVIDGIAQRSAYRSYQNDRVEREKKGW